MFHNIEASVFRKGEYIGYSNYGVWRITKVNSACGKWQAVRGNVLLFANTLREMSTKLEEVRI